VNESAKKLGAPLTTIEARLRKWEPLVRDLGKREAALAAWLMEEEARYWRDLAHEEGKDAVFLQMGHAVKFMLPALAHAAPKFVDNLDATFTEIALKLEEAVEERLSPQPGSCVIHEPTAMDDIRRFVGPLAERAHAAMRSYKERIEEADARA